MEPQQLIQLAVEACGGDELELAKRLGLKLSNATTQLRRWRNGTHKPDYDTTWKLLDIAGLVMLPDEKEKVLSLLQGILEMDPERDDQVAALEALARAFEAQRWTR